MTVADSKTALLAEGTFGPNDLDLVVSDEPLFQYKPEFEAQLEALWQAKLAEAAEKGYKLWNSQTYALKKLTQTDSRLRLELGLVDYKHQVGLVQLIESGAVGPERFSKQMYCSLLVRTSDGAYVFGIGRGLVYHGELKFVGGFYSKDELALTDGESVFQLARNELQEEVGVEPDGVESIHLKRIYLTTRGMIDLTFFVQLTIDGTTVQTLFDRLVEPEFAALKIMTRAEARVVIPTLGRQRALKVDLLI